MKIHAVSFKSAANAHAVENIAYSGGINPFFYTAAHREQKNNLWGNTFRLTTALLAAAAVLITLINIRGSKQFPKSIIELKGKNDGLNKLTKYRKNVEELKNVVLYPLIATIKGDNRFLKSNEFKSGIVITGKTVDEAKTVVEAFCEHAEKLGVRVIKAIPEKGADGKLSKFSSRTSRVKAVYNTLKDANRYYKETGKYTVVNIDNISLLANLKSSKPKHSNFENFLRAFDKNTYPGVIWIASNPKSTALPYFFNNIPVLMTKLMD